MMQCGRTKINQVLWLGVGAIAIVGCSNDSQKIAAQIQQDVITNGGTSLKTVTCPSGIQPEPGKTFECVGEMDNGYTFTITVQPQDDKGTAFTWDVPHAKGLINVPKLESVIQENLTTEIGSKPSVACGGIYKAVKPGEGFECQITYKRLKPIPKSAKGQPAKAVPSIALTQTEKINVTTDDSGNVSWQRILPQLATKPKSTAPN